MKSMIVSVIRGGTDKQNRLVRVVLLVTTLLLGLILSACAPRYWQLNCEDAAWTVCRSLERQGITARVAICKTPWSESKGIYHAQCVALIDGEWRWMILDRWPLIEYGPREYGEPVEYREVDKRS